MQHRWASSWILLLASVACARADGNAAPNPAEGSSGSEAPAGKSAPALATSPEAAPQLAQVPLPSADPPALSPSPVVCSGGASPSTLVSAPPEIGDIALSATDVYWSAYDGIHRVPKQGGSDRLVAAVTSAAGLRIAGNLLYWASWPGIFAMPLDESAPPLQLVSDLATPLTWAATESSVYYMAESTRVDGECTGNRLKSVPSQGQGSGAVVLAETASNFDQLAVDATGVYWAEAFGCTSTSTQIDEYTFATSSVSRFAATTGVPHSLRAAGGRLLWLDEGGVWSQAVDGGEPLLLAAPAIVRGLATDGTSAYWAASAPGEGNSDIFMAPLAGGSAPRTVACQIYGIDEFWFLADTSAVYYRAWTLDLLARLSAPGSAQP